MSTTARTTLDEYHRMIARGEFEPVEANHVELIRLVESTMKWRDGGK